ncbi:hypothetical protein ACQKND_04010 [Viridibacillus arvi]|uniref:hypothetical protein n=1 Tax=Viridibacillus arvi TaxID=263475 RepID=UPI003D009D7D
MNNNLNIKKIKFNYKPDSVPYFYRLSYRASLTCLILKISCRKNSACSLTKIHLITTSLYTEKEMQLLIKEVTNSNLYAINLRFDPTVNKTMDFLLSEGIVSMRNNLRFFLTKKGEEFTEQIINNPELLTKEKEFLSKLSTNLTESKIGEISNLLKMR